MNRWTWRWTAVVIGVLSGEGVWAQDIDTSQPGLSTLRFFDPERREMQLEFEAGLDQVASAARLKAWHEMLADVPHIAGSEGDRQTIEDLVREFGALGLEVETHWFWAYLPDPKDAELEIVAPVRESLSVREPPVAGDPYSSHPDLTIGFNAYSGSGEVEGEVVYANYGRKEDFERLKSLGIEVRGRIVVVRYGGNFRGYKVKYAEERGAVGVIIYTDPADSGYMRGLMYPEGGWAREDQIQRGSIKALGYPGDPLTPFIEATERAKRTDLRGVPLPKIPVQPIGWGAARRILEQMTGQGVGDESWQGALPFAYRLTGGPELRLRLKVDQERRIIKTANVIAKLEGSTYPEELVIVGCHHDAWCFGASDPLSGMILVMESARCYSELARQGQRPERTILFCGWGAEESGVIGSVEWVEANRDQLVENAVAYLNLDAATMGPLFKASGSPILRHVIVDAAARTPQAREPTRTALDGWIERSEGPGEGIDRVAIGGMGGGSDHQGFYFHCGVPSFSLASRGAPGTAYHSNYDNLHWYQKVVGDDYEPALMLTRAVNVALARLARADVLPFDPRAYGPELRDALVEIDEKIDTAKAKDALASAQRAISECDQVSESFLVALLSAIERGDLDAATTEWINSEVMMSLERTWLRESGIPGRPWFRNLYMAPDETSGYAFWPVPAVRKGLEQANTDRITLETRDLENRIRGLSNRLRANMLSEE